MDKLNDETWNALMKRIDSMSTDEAIATILRAVEGTGRAGDPAMLFSAMRIYDNSLRVRKEHRRARARALRIAGVVLISLTGFLVYATDGVSFAAIASTLVLQFLSGIGWASVAVNLQTWIDRDGED